MTLVPIASDGSVLGANPVLSEVPYDHPDARSLTQSLRAEQASLYGFADDPADTPSVVFDASTDGRFVVAYVGGEPVGCGGIRRLDTRTAEIKRMYTVDHARGYGIGTGILDHLERHAASFGADKVLLETGRHNMAALALYRRAGYGPCRSYVPGRDLQVNRAMTKRLDSV
ncbi:GNAT family N-acetyltransferase [Streptomyces lonarensis]|uniref:GNAT family N-acetyltransferase n=1 Tax=Streptomyces lonarensis TaxID=700599 RepID=A0A7X6CWR3_9ACTN|nr:GNAT family N-acetyltransferase [Streptomyces lonarensis]NJQ04026.1 GNAT family N-acetyltransferase [Streptomyces lonarensis]